MSPLLLGSLSLSSVKMHFLPFLAVGLTAPIAVLAAPARDFVTRHGFLHTRENLCSLKSPPSLCQPNSSVTVEETAQRAYKFYRAFVVDGDPRTMFSLIDSVYQVTRLLLWLCEDRLGTDTCAATSPRICKRSKRHLVPLLQREQDCKREEQLLVFRCQRKHVVCAVLDYRSVALG
jgi:hypothetical protein